MSNVSRQSGSLLVRGSVVKVRRRCGKNVCKCVNGELHETWALSYSHQGRTRMVPLRQEDVREVQRAVARYQRALERLQSEALQGIKRLHASVKAAKRRTR